MHTPAFSTGEASAVVGLPSRTDLKGASDFSPTHPHRTVDAVGMPAWVTMLALTKVPRQRMSHHIMHQASLVCQIYHPVARDKNPSTEYILCIYCDYDTCENVAKNHQNPKTLKKKLKHVIMWLT